MAVCMNWQGRDGTILEWPHGRSTSGRDEGTRVVWNYSSGALLVRYDHARREEKWATEKLAESDQTFQDDFDELIL
jgi:hypothetical protein